MLPSQLFNEPACTHQRKKAPGQRCALPKPGSASGGCAFDGAQIVGVPLADVAHLVHGPIACLGNSWDVRGALSSGPDLYRTAFTTDLDESGIVFGGEKRLLAAIREVVQRFHPPAVMVYATCVTALIGDDLEETCQKAGEELGIPVIPVNAPGFLGSKNLGNRASGQALLDHVIGTREPEGDTSQAVNLIGDYNIAGELWNITPLLERLGIRLLATISGDGRFQAVAGAHRARANMVVCSKALLNVGRGMQERWGIPFFEGSFYGRRETSRALSEMARLIGDPELIARTRALIAEEEARLLPRLAPYLPVLKGKRALLYTGGVKSWSVISALLDLGMTVVATGVGKSTEEDETRIKELLGPEARLIREGAPKKLLALMEELQADILLAGGRNLYTAIKNRYRFLDINQERHHTYTGYDGLVHLAQELAREFGSPVYEAVRRPAPWEA